MKETKEELERLLGSKEFSSYKKKHKDAYLSSFFVIMPAGKPEEAEMEIDFYCPKSSRLQGFVMKDGIMVKPEDEVFQKEKAAVPELKAEGAKGLADALDAAEAVRKERHAGEFSSKIIAVLQSIEGKAVWNVTILTDTLKVINMRLDAESLALISETMESLLSYRVSK